jgi:hypothetical protein
MGRGKREGDKEREGRRGREGRRERNQVCLQRYALSDLFLPPTRPPFLMVHSAQNSSMD